MRNKSVIYLLIAFLGLSCVVLNSAVRAELQNIADLYESEQTDNAKLLLQKAIPVTDEEKAFVLYYKAMLSIDGSQAKALLQQLCDTYPKQPMMQKALLELGHIQLLDRDYSAALSSYRKITDPGLPEKVYWIANTQYEMGELTNAIASAEMFLRSAKSTGLAEEAYFLIADAYLSLDQYNNAINTLNKLKSTQKEIEDEQYYRYRLGYANELLGNRAEALNHYKTGYEINRFSQLAYLIEDRLFYLRGKYGSVVDLSFLYPYSEAPLPEIVINTPVNGTNNTDVNTPLEPVPVPPVTSKLIDKAPDKGIFLQAGRFSNKANAAKLSDRIATAGYPCQYYQTTNYKDVSWVVVCGPFETNQLASDARDTLKNTNIDSFIIQR